MSSVRDTSEGIHDANFPVDPEGRVYHLGVKRGEVANRVISVGDPNRARRIASYMERAHVVATNRGFTCYTGLYRGVPVSVIATGMGSAMADFMVRESRAVVEGPMAMVRLGTCGTPNDKVRIGQVAVANKSCFVGRNYAAFERGHEHEDAYTVSGRVAPDPELQALLARKLREALGASTVVEGGNATCDTFYSAQGRQDPRFEDRNASLVDKIMRVQPDTVSIEMESFVLLHLAKCSKGSIKSAACCIVLAQRNSGEFLDADSKHRLEAEGGKAVLEAMVEFPIEGAQAQGVWNDPLKPLAKL